MTDSDQPALEQRVRRIILRDWQLRALSDGRLSLLVLLSKKQDWPEAIVRRFPNQKSGVIHRPGQLLWVAEAWRHGSTKALFRVDDVCPSQQEWRSAATMPRAASRWTLRVTDVAVKRTGDLLDREAREMGAPVVGGCALGPARQLWDAQHGKSGLTWASNPWVELARVEAIRENVERVAS